MNPLPKPASGHLYPLAPTISTPAACTSSGTAHHDWVMSTTDQAPNARHNEATA